MKAPVSPDNLEFRLPLPVPQLEYKIHYWRKPRIVQKYERLAFHFHLPNFDHFTAPPCTIRSKHQDSMYLYIYIASSLSTARKTLCLLCRGKPLEPISTGNTAGCSPRPLGLATFPSLPWSAPSKWPEQTPVAGRCRICPAEPKPLQGRAKIRILLCRH